MSRQKISLDHRTNLLVGDASISNAECACQHYGVDEVLGVAELSAILSLEVHSVRKLIYAGLPHVFVDRDARYTGRSPQQYGGSIFTTYPLLEGFLVQSCDAHVIVPNITVQSISDMRGKDFMSRTFLHKTSTFLEVEQRRLPLTAYPVEGRFSDTLADTLHHPISALNMTGHPEDNKILITQRWYTLKELPVVLKRSPSSTGLLRYLLPSLLFLIPGSSTMYQRRVQLLGNGLNLNEQISKTTELLKYAFKSPVVTENFES